MFLPRKQTETARVTMASRVTPKLRTRLEQRAVQAGYTPSAAIAEFLEMALELEEKLKPFRPAIERLVREDGLSLAEAIVELLWMGVELNPTNEG